jgi:hypothetical protein
MKNFTKETYKKLKEYTLFYVDFDSCEAFKKKNNEKGIDVDQRIQETVLKGGTINIPFDKMSIYTRPESKLDMLVVIESLEPNYMEAFVHYDSQLYTGIIIEIYEGKKIKIAPITNTHRIPEDELEDSIMNLGNYIIMLLLYLTDRETYKYVENTGLGNKIRKGRIFTNKIVHVYNKKQKNIKTLSSKGSIDYKHIFAVSGHWRRIKALGKNRAGEYVVKGYTWVTEHLKGSGEFIDKARVIKG